MTNYTLIGCLNSANQFQLVATAMNPSQLNKLKHQANFKTLNVKVDLPPWLIRKQLKLITNRETLKCGNTVCSIIYGEFCSHAGKTAHERKSHNVIAYIQEVFENSPRSKFKLALPVVTKTRVFWCSSNFRFVFYIKCSGTN